MKNRIPFVVTILGMVGGVFIAIFFGVNEDIFKGKIKKDLLKNPKLSELVSEQERETFLKKEATKCWRYYQRYHFHATGIGAMALSTLVFLFFLGAPPRGKTLASYLISIGGFLYPFIWLFAGIYGPEMGRSAAKESFIFFGYMGGLFLVGLLLSLYFAVRYPLARVSPD